MSRAEVRLYDEIGGWGVSAEEFARELGEVDADVIDLRVNSPGGSVFEGVTIMNALRRHPARVEVTVDGLAASAASFIALSGDHVVMNSGAELMIHEAWTYAEGDAASLRAMADNLERTSQMIAGLYAKRAGGEPDGWRELMRAETWYSAEEAVAAGLADEWADAPAAEARFDLSRFGYRGRGGAVVARAGVGRPVDGPANEDEEESMALRDDLVERLGLDAEVTDEEIVAAVDALIERADAAEGGESGGEPDEAASAAAVTVDRAAFEALQAQAAAGAQALERMNAERREGLVAAAVRDGRIAPASRAVWLEQLAANEEGASKLLAALPVNTVPVVEIGVQDGIESESDALYMAAWGSRGEKGAE